MTNAVLIQLARRFIAGDLGAEELGAIVTTTSRRDIIAASFGAIELERDANGATFGFHAWPAIAFDRDAWSDELGTPSTLARRGPDDPVSRQYLANGGIVVVDVELDRIRALHVYRFAAGSLAGAISREADLFALVELVGGTSYTLDAVSQILGRPRKSDDWRVELDVRPGSNLRGATVELLKNAPHGMQLDLAQPMTVDFNVLRARFGRETRSIFGNPPSFRKTYLWEAPTARLMLSTYEQMAGDRCTIDGIIVRRNADPVGEFESEEVTKPKGRRAPASPLGPDRVVAFVDALFERGLDEAGIHAMLGEPVAPAAHGRTRLQPHDPDLDGVTLDARGDRLTVEIELCEAAAMSPALLEPHLGASIEVQPLHAHDASAQRFHVNGASYAGYVLVAPQRVTLHRAPRNACLGDFARGEDLVALIQRVVDDPQLTADTVVALVGDPAGVIEFDERRRCQKILPFTGSNAKEVAVYYNEPSRVVHRMELSLRSPRELDFRTIARVEPFTGPKPSLLEMKIIQYNARYERGVVLLNTIDRRDGPIQLVRSTIIDERNI